MTGEGPPGRRADDRVAVICEALRACFGDQALVVAERQMGAAIGDARMTWRAVVVRLRA